MLHVRQNSALRSAQFPRKAAEQETGDPVCYGQHDCVGSGIAGIARAAAKHSGGILL